MTRKPAPKRSRKRPVRKDPQHLKVALALLFLVGFLLLALVLIGQLRDSWRQPPQVSKPPVAVSSEQLLAEIRYELETALLRRGLPLDALREGTDAGVPRLQVTAVPLDAEALQRLEARLQRLSPAIRLASRAAELDVLLDGRPAFRLEFLPPAPPVPGTHPRLAIIMDDLGRDQNVAREMLAIDLPVTFAILPETPHASQIATLAHRRGREVMIHIPMEPLGYPAVSPGPEALFTNLSDAEIRRRFLGYLDRIPYAVGGNNHMGSKFTMDVAGMRSVLQVMKDEGLFFVDSRTTGGSVALREARQMGIPGISRDVFLDNVAEVQPIETELRKLVKLAQKRGVAVGICHPYPATVAALRSESDFLKTSGVELVPVSRLVHP